MNTTLAVVVSAIVILITALVVITIFSGGITQVGTLGQAKTICSTQYITMCQSTGQKPVTWDIKNMNVNGEMVSCATAAPSCQCTGTGSGPFTGSCA